MTLREEIEYIIKKYELVDATPRIMQAIEARMLTVEEVDGLISTDDERNDAISIHDAQMRKLKE